MSGSTARAVVVALVVVHTALLAAYTFPERIVPRSFHLLGQRYSRPLFHQRWNLFAPDPPLCSCEVQVGIDEAAWRPLHASDAHYLTRRMARSISWYVQAELGSGGNKPSIEMQEAMRSMVRDIARDVQDLQFRLVEQCVMDPSEPLRRVERITPLIMESK